MPGGCKDVDFRPCAERAVAAATAATAAAVTAAVVLGKQHTANDANCHK